MGFVMLLAHPFLLLLTIFERPFLNHRGMLLLQKDRRRRRRRRNDDWKRRRKEKGERRGDPSIDGQGGSCVRVREWDDYCFISISRTVKYQDLKTVKTFFKLEVSKHSPQFWEQLDELFHSAAIPYKTEEGEGEGGSCGVSN